MIPVLQALLLRKEQKVINLLSCNSTCICFAELKFSPLI